ncbi:NBR1-Ig-like domain-containing protein [Nonomuraea sp. N2-4H]|uniref:NBR1-Ig-like domain-containing protein n=1 Tax=Nonomuraea sp. N2-4H TaxID=3128898 RepID=UPI00324515D7
MTAVVAVAGVAAVVLGWLVPTVAGDRQEHAAPTSTTPDTPIPPTAPASPHPATPTALTSPHPATPTETASPHASTPTEPTSPHTSTPTEPISPHPATPTVPASPHDDSVFERDVTYPDGSVVRAGERFDKTWRIRNAGNVHWHDRYLTRMNDTPCKAPKRVAIGPVRPGESVDITVRVRASDSPGRCKIYWKMTDEDGAPLLADKRPIFLDVTVA